MTMVSPTSRLRGSAAICRSCPVAPNGFTLIELVIALALVALITVLLFSGLRLGGRAWDGVDAVAERNAELRSARGFLDRTLSQARDLVLRVEAQNHEVFTGDATSLEFVAPLSENVGIPGLYILRLGLEGSGAQTRLVLTRWLLHPDVLAGNTEAPEWQPLDPRSPSVPSGHGEERDMSAGAYGQTVLLEGVGLFDLAYFGVAEETGLGGAATVQTTGTETEAKWYDQWVDQPHPPKLIRIRLTSRRQGWPDSIIALPQVEQTTGVGVGGGLTRALPQFPQWASR